MVGYTHPQFLLKAIGESGMSNQVGSLWYKMMSAIAGSGGPAQSMLDTIADVLPIALTVAGAILVVNLGWRLFRNFTHG